MRQWTMEGIITILIMWPLCSLAAIVGTCWLFASWGRPKRRAKPKRAAAPPVIKVVKPSPPASPSYLRRWNLNRRWWVVSEKAAWKEDFENLLRAAPVPPEPAAAPAAARPSAGAEPSAPPADTSEVFRKLRERLDNLT